MDGRSPLTPRAVLLGEAARALIEALPGARDPDVLLFPRHAEGRGIWILTDCWRTVCADAKLGRLRLHDLRHTVATQAVMAGEKLPLSTNGMDSFWAMLKRGHQGIYHKMSPKHLDRYCQEFSGRHNARDADTIDQMTGSWTG